MKSGACLGQLLEGKKLLIFDFDGTVADTSPLHAEAFAKALSGLDIAVDYSSIAGLKTADAMRKLLTFSGNSFTEQDIQQLTKRKQAIVREMISENLEPLPGVDAFLRWARTRYHLSMVTSGSRATVHIALDKLGYKEWFNPIICADDVENAKPDPEGFLTVLKLIGIPASEALVFEDSDAGFNASKAANIDFIDVSHFDWQNALSDIGDKNGN